MRLNLKRDQAREIIKVIVLLNTEEKCYNPFYKLLLSKLISVDKDHKYTFHYTIWDHMKLLKESDENQEKDTNYFTPKKIHNLAKLTAELLADEKISLPVFLNFEFEDASENQKIFVISTFDKYFEKITVPDRCKLLFAKLVKNDDHDCYQHIDVDNYLTLMFIFESFSGIFTTIFFFFNQNWVIFFVFNLLFLYCTN